MYKTPSFNDFYTKNKLISKLVESYDYAGSRSKTKKFVTVKDERAIVQAYVNSDRCSFTHPELCFWDRVNESMILNIAKTYYSNNPHFKYILYMYGLMVKRFDLDFAKLELGVDQNNPFFIHMMEGKKALSKILSYLGLGPDSPPMSQIWKEHLGLFSLSSP
jgi:hypothetical protein